MQKEKKSKFSFLVSATPPVTFDFNIRPQIVDSYWLGKVTWPLSDTEDQHFGVFCRYRHRMHFNSFSCQADFIPTEAPTRIVQKTVKVSKTKF